MNEILSSFVDPHYCQYYTGDYLVSRSAAKHHVTAESLAAELQHSGLFNEKAVAVIKHLWGEQVREYI
jgi:hypothetical protein